MSFLSNLNSSFKIGIRIYAGFAVVLILLSAMAARGYFNLTSTSATFEQYAAISGNTLGVAEADRAIVSLRRNLKEYVRTSSKGTVDRIHEVGKHAREILGTLATKAYAAEQREQAKHILASLDQFMANFELIAKSQTELNHALNDVMNPLGAKLSAKLADIIKGAMDDADMSGAANAGIAQQQLMQARLGVAEFLQTNDPKLVATSERQFAVLLEGLKRLNEVTNDDARQKKAAEVAKETPGFISAFRAAVKVIAERARLVDDVNAKLAAEMTKTMEQMKTAQLKGLAALKQSADIGIASSITFSLMMAGIALALGMVFAWYIGRGVTRPIMALTNTMDALAGGNLDAEVPGIDRRDELGVMAKSVLTFKEAGRANIRLQAQSVEKDKESAAARAAAAAKAMEEFDAAVGDIIKAAMAGDFSRRVALEGKDGVILNVASAMNTMCENFSQVMDDLSDMLAALAEGNLTRRINADYHGMFGILKDNANSTADRLSETISEIKAAAREVTSASAEISGSTTDLSQRTEEQAASLEETTASMEEIAATVKKNAENAQAANRSASATREVADRGGQVVAKAVDAMAKIEDSSRKISDIIGVIDEIARQTNLLALNAAVEAARAGEAGRGFAVVASEVRSLAQRSSQAAKDIKDLITNSNGQVNDGVDLVNKAGAALTEIVDSIKKVAEIVADIANASNEQATGIEQVNKALTQMDEVTQQNSALVEENAATAKTLEHQAKAMDERVSFFKLDAAVEGRPAAMPVTTREPRPNVAPQSRGPAAAPKQQPAAAPKRAVAATNAGGPIRRMQATFATAVNEKADWKEF